MKCILYTIVFGLFFFQTSLAQSTSESEESIATCEDGIQNGDEKEVDCGGEFCEPCIRTAEEMDNITVLAYPNPCASQVSFRCMLGDISSIKLYSADGILLYTSGGINRKDVNIDLSSMESQILLARLDINGRTVQKKIIKM